MLIKVIRNKDGFELFFPPYMANDRNLMRKLGCHIATDEVKKPPIQPVIDAKMEIEGEMLVYSDVENNFVQVKDYKEPVTKEPVDYIKIDKNGIVTKETYSDDGTLNVSVSTTTKLPLGTDITTINHKPEETIITKVPVKKGRKAKK